MLYGRDTSGGAWADLAQVECLFQLAADAKAGASQTYPTSTQGCD